MLYVIDVRDGNRKKNKTASGSAATFVRPYKWAKQLEFLGDASKEDE